MNNEIDQLKKRVEKLENFIESLQASQKIPLAVDQAFRQRFLGDVVSASSVLTVPFGGTGASTLMGILKGSGTSAITAITQLAGSKVYYVADSSEGAVTRKLTFTDGVLTAET